ncbi:hypothetical protein BDW59DRAFT_169998 [Aspergillus cavernicola]|uniref:MARVEL domain-containing protein n=1 Tax=Aspergillus cavernicola TaxID=176166 RepID=A0ABR4ISY1_9EURO
MSSNPYYADDRHKTIIGLRLLSIATSLPVFPALAWAMSAHSDVFNDGVGIGLIPGVVAGTAYAFLWSCIVLVIHLAFRKPIHPGIYLAFDFIAFGLLASVTILMIIFIEPFLNSAYSCESGSSCKGEALRRVEWFEAVMALICCATHFVLFVWACWATDKDRKSKK